MLKATSCHVNKEYNSQVFVDPVAYSLAHLGVYSFLFSISFFVSRIYVLEELEMEYVGVMEYDHIMMVMEMEYESFVLVWY